MDVCKSTEIADSDSDDEQDEDEAGSDNEKEDKDNDEEDRVVIKAMGLHDSDGEEEDQKEGKKETKKDSAKSEEKEVSDAKSDTAKRLVRGAWPCWEDRSAFSANQGTWAPLVVHYSVCQNLQG